MPAARQGNPRKGRLSRLQAAAEQLRLTRPAAQLWRPAALALPPLAELHQVHTARLLPARYSESVLTGIAESSADLDAIYALDNATNERLLAESSGRVGLALDELVFGLPHARIINATFAHPHPQGARFSTPYRGAWYAGFDLATAKAEVLFHRSVQLKEIRWSEPEALDYDHYQAEFTGPFHDLRPTGFAREISAKTVTDTGAEASWDAGAYLDPDSYLASQQLTMQLLDAGSLGVVYPSIRKPGGTCLACFRPHAVSRVRKRGLHRLLWYPDGPATFARTPRSDQQAAGLLLQESPAASAERLPEGDS